MKKPEPMSNIDRPFPKSGDSCCFIGRAVIRHIRKIRRELNASKREIKRLRAILDGA